MNFDITEKVDLLNTYSKGITLGKLKAGPEYVKAYGLYNAIFSVGALRDFICNQGLDSPQQLRYLGAEQQGILTRSESLGSKSLGVKQITQDRPKLALPKLIIHRSDPHIS